LGAYDADAGSEWSPDDRFVVSPRK
jgi:hypothetical protein